MKQVLVTNFKDNKCPYCDGRGFYLVQQKPGNSLIAPNDVIECKFCGGTGRKLKAG